MNQRDPSELFDEAHAARYDESFTRMAPLRETLHLLTLAGFSDLPLEEGRILCVGAGTGLEILFLAERFPKARFVAVEPSGPMLEVCRRRIAEHQLEGRCEFFHGYVESLPGEGGFEAATSILVSHFILSPERRGAYFKAIAERLRPGGRLVSADLAFDTASPLYPEALALWLRLLKTAKVDPEQIEKFRAAYERDVALWPPEKVEALLAANGFSQPLRAFQTGLIHGWVAQRTATGN